jgi:hypothetical protein
VENRFTIYSTGHRHSVEVCQALAAGTGYPVAPPAPLQEGGVAMYGYLRGLLPTLRRAQYERRPWVYADRGYFKASYDMDYTGFFRLTRDRYQHAGRGYSDGKRWRALGLAFSPWKRGGRHIVVCPPGDVFAESVGRFRSDEWLRMTLSELRRHTDRPIVVREKRAARQHTLSEDLVSAHALVTYMSNAATGALMDGIPVFCLGPCAAQSMGRDDLAAIEDPHYPDDRERWAGVLADNQWTLDEVRQGFANRLFEGEA